MERWLKTLMPFVVENEFSFKLSFTWKIMTYKDSWNIHGPVMYVAFIWLRRCESWRPNPSYNNLTLIWTSKVQYLVSLYPFYWDIRICCLLVCTIIFVGQQVVHTLVQDTKGTLRSYRRCEVWPTIDGRLDS